VVFPQPPFWFAIAIRLISGSQPPSNGSELFSAEAVTDYGTLPLKCDCVNTLCAQPGENRPSPALHSCLVIAPYLKYASFLSASCALDPSGFDQAGSKRRVKTVRLRRYTRASSWCTRSVVTPVTTNVLVPMDCVASRLRARRNLRLTPAPIVGSGAPTLHRPAVATGVATLRNQVGEESRSDPWGWSTYRPSKGTCRSSHTGTASCSGHRLRL